MPKYLQKRRRRWYAVMEIPKALRKKFGGQSRFVQSLGTESLSEAEKLVLPVVARWKAEIEAAKSGSRKSVDDIIALAVEFKQGRERDSEQDRELRNELIDDKARDIEWKDSEAAKTFFRIAHGKSIPLDRYVEEWLAGLKNEPKTKDMKRSSVLSFSSEFGFSHEVDNRKVRVWAHGMQEEGYAPATITRIVSACRGYWDFLNRAGHINRDDDPFEKAVTRVSTKSKSVQASRRQAFTHDHLGQVLQAAIAKNDEPLRDLIWVAIWTGCRIEELCSLSLKHTHLDRIEVVDSKTEAGNREVPIHPRLVPVMGRLRKNSTDGFLISGLTTNKYSDRSNAIGKRFGRMKEKLGFDDRYVFHSIRKSVATELENQGVPENVAADIMGHDKKTMTYGTYSGGTSLDVKKDALLRLNYRGLKCQDLK